MTPAIGLKQFRQESLLSYVLHDPSSRLALLIDPERVMLDDCRGYLMERGLKLAGVLDTTRAQGADSPAARACDEHRCPRAEPGFKLGTLELGFLPAPHAGNRQAIALAAPGALFTGFAPWDEIARSGDAAVSALPDSTLLYASVDERQVNFSTLGHERARPSTGDGSGLASISVEKYAHKLGKEPAESAFVDVRERDEFEAGHIPGALNFPLSELGLHLNELGKFRRLYVSCLSGKRSIQAARTLVYLGFPEVINLSGGFQAWARAGLPAEKGSGK